MKKQSPSVPKNLLHLHRINDRQPPSVVVVIVVCSASCPGRSKLLDREGRGEDLHGR